MAESNTPTHIGFILDGNRRWASQHGLSKLKGHNEGYKNLKNIGDLCLEKGVKYVSAYIFSTENWKRSQEEVGYLMDLAVRMLTRDLNEIHKKDIKLVFLGSRDRISAKIKKLIDKAETLTRNNTRGTLAICFNYGGQEEIVAGVKKLIDSGIKSSQITTQKLKQALYTADIPAPDLIVRTSGEQRLSNFLLWDSAYSELYFPAVMWPDFNEAELDKALAEYSKRQRRFGA